jgi:hypothetical protein
MVMVVSPEICIVVLLKAEYGEPESMIQLMKMWSKRRYITLGNIVCFPTIRRDISQVLSVTVEPIIQDIYVLASH